MKHKLSFIAALWWVLLCAIAGLFLILTANKRSRASDTENRMLAGFPEVSVQSVTSGDFMEDFEGFLTDGFFGRDSVIAATDRLLGSFSTLKGDDLLAVKAADMEKRLESEGAAQFQTDASTESEAEADVPPEADATGEVDEIDATESAGFEGDVPLTAKNSYLWLDRVDGEKKLLYRYSNDEIRTYSETLKLMQSYLPEDGVICFTQVPLAQIANRWTDQQDTYSGWGSSVETVLEGCLADTERIYVFNTFDILEPHMTGDTDMFYHTDHHWTAEAACLVLQEMLKRQNLPVIPYEEYSYKAIRGKTNSQGETDTFNALYPLLPGHSYVVTHGDEQREIALMNYDYAGYLAFMNNSRQPWRRVVTGADTGRKALVICDSFGNAFVPYLLPYYDEVHMCDFRAGYYKKQDAGGAIGELMRYHGIDDVYIITSTANGLRKPNSLKYLREFLVG